MIPGVRPDDRVRGTGGRVYHCPDVGSVDRHLAKLSATRGAARRANALDIDKLLARRALLTTDRGES